VIQTDYREVPNGTPISSELEKQHVIPCPQAAVERRETNRSLVKVKVF
jgi:hypothetical protein